MPFRFLAPELARWDSLDSSAAATGATGAAGSGPELLVMPFFSDERPLRGAAGLVDWRLCGRLSRLILDGRIGGELGESVLIPGRRLPFHKLMLLGMGASDHFGENRFRRVARDIGHAVKQLGVRRWALPLPGRATGRIAPRQALELWLDEVGDHDEVWLVEPSAAQKDLTEALGKRLRTV